MLDYFYSITIFTSENLLFINESFFPKGPFQNSHTTVLTVREPSSAHSQMRFTLYVAPSPSNS